MAINTISFTKTPQANNDSYTYQEDYLLSQTYYDDSSHVLMLDVMENDLGGNAKKLYSIDDGANALTDLLKSNVITSWEETENKNLIRINAGKVEIDITRSLSAYGTSLNNLPEGKTIHDTFVYAIQLGNGTLSYATVTLDIIGNNDGPEILGSLHATAVEGENAFCLNLLFGASDKDFGETEKLTVESLAYAIDGIPTGNNGTDMPTGLSISGSHLTVDTTHSVFDDLAVGESTTITVNYFVTDIHGATVAQTQTITISGTNDDVLVSSAVATGGVTEDGAASASGTVGFTDVDLTDVHTVSSALKTSDYATAMGSFSVVKTTDTSGTGTGGVASWSYNLDNSAAQRLAKDQVVTEVYTITLDDNNGDTVTQDVIITITGTNDDVLVSSAVATGGVTEDGAASASGTVGFTDVDLTDVHTVSSALKTSDYATAMGSFSVVKTTDTSGTGTGGVATWTYNLDNSAAQRLAKDQVVTEVYTITLDDNNGDTVTQDVTITITGTNDGPVVAMAADVTSAITEAGTPTENDTDTPDVDESKLTDSGTIAFSDVDLTDGHSISSTITASDGALGTLTASVTTDTTGIGTGGIITWNYSVAASAVEYLAKNQTKIETFTITLDDGNGGQIDRTIEVTITGTNDGPVIGSGAEQLLGSVKEDETLTASGQLSATDVDEGDHLHWSVLDPDSGSSFSSLAGTYGTIAVDATGKWTYTLSNNSDNVQSLTEGDHYEEVFTIRVTDDQGDFVDQTVTVTVNGTEDVPVQEGFVAGDANNDGVKDVMQTNVASTTVGDSGVWVTFEAESATEAENSPDAPQQEIRNLIVDNNPFAVLGMGEAPFGTLSYDVILPPIPNTTPDAPPPPPQSTTMTAYLSGNWMQSNGGWVNSDTGDFVNGVWKQGPGGAWVDIADSITTLNGKLALKYTLTDGDPLTDEDGIVNGVIVDPIVIGSGVHAPEVAWADSGVQDDHTTNNGLVTVSNLEDGATLQYQVNGGDWIAVSGNQFTLSGDGQKSVWVRQVSVDSVVSGETAIDLILDQTPPTGLRFTDPSSNYATNKAWVGVTGLEPLATYDYRIDNGVWQKGAGDGFQLTQGDGIHTIDIRQVDAAGNVSSLVSKSLTLDTTAPMIVDPSYSPGMDLFKYYYHGYSWSSFWSYTIKEEYGHRHGVFSVNVADSQRSDVARATVVFNGVEHDLTKINNLVLNQENGHYYKFLYAPRSNYSWQEANEYAKSVGGYLATITSASENQFILNTAKSVIPAEDLLWLGASDGYRAQSSWGSWHDISSEGNWKWQDGPEFGSSFYYNNMAIKPMFQSYADTFDYLVMRTYSTSDGSWSAPAGSWTHLPNYPFDGLTGQTPGLVIEYDRNPGYVFVSDDSVTSYEFRFYDQLGNFSASSMTLAPPKLSLANDTGAKDGYSTRDGAVAVSGLASGASFKYSTDGGATWINGSGSAISVTGEGIKKILVSQTDSAGHTSAATSMTFRVDTTSPFSKPTLSWNDTGVKDGAQTRDGLITVGGLDADSHFQYRTFSTLGNGWSGWKEGWGKGIYLTRNDFYIIEARQIDDAGNISTEVASTSLILDQIALTPSTYHSQYGVNFTGTYSKTVDPHVRVFNLEPGAIWEYANSNSYHAVETLPNGATKGDYSWIRGGVNDGTNVNPGFDVERNIWASNWKVWIENWTLKSEWISMDLPQTWLVHQIDLAGNISANRMTSFTTISVLDEQVNNIVSEIVTEIAPGVMKWVGIASALGNVVAGFFSGNPYLIIGGLNRVSKLTGGQYSQEIDAAYSVWDFTSGFKQGYSEANGSTWYKLYAGMKGAIFPAGVAGEPINMGLTDLLRQDSDGLIDLTITNVPDNWQISEGTRLSDGSWQVRTADPSALTITSPIDYSGAIALRVIETRDNSDGSQERFEYINNIEVYSPDSPIFAWGGDDNLTSSAGSDEFVIGEFSGAVNIYKFDVASDRVNLAAVSNFKSFADVINALAIDEAGNAVLVLGEAKAITFVGLNPEQLHPENFIFDVAPTFTNSGEIIVSNGSILPIGGIVENNGVISLESSTQLSYDGAFTDELTMLQLAGDSISLAGGGKVVLSDSFFNVIKGESVSTKLINLDNTISGSGSLGGSQMILENHSYIDASGIRPLLIDTGANVVVNSGTLQSSGSGGLLINSDLFNTGMLSANNSNIYVKGALSGSGSTVLDGTSNIEFGAASSNSIIFTDTASGTLRLTDSDGFTGTVSGLNNDDALYFLDIDISSASWSYTPNAEGAGGILTVTDGVDTANVTLIGQYASGGFQLVGDGMGGTAVTYA